MTHFKIRSTSAREDVDTFTRAPLTEWGLLGVVLHLHHGLLHGLDVADQLYQVLHLLRQLTRQNLKWKGRVIRVRVTGGGGTKSEVETDFRVRAMADSR